VVVPLDDPVPAVTTAVQVLGSAGDGKPVRRHHLVQLTAYSASVEEDTAWGITYTGVRASPGTVAVDPAVIPLGSRLRIDGLPGLYRAEDTGGGIRGAHVDVFMDSRREALQFGRRYAVPVEILD
jgi:3D (Asp-Asp-Asp) domain-containing protein